MTAIGALAVALSMGAAVAPTAAQDQIHAPAHAPSQPGGACPVFRWTTLGTAGGPIPTLERAEPSNLLDAGGQAILVDAGDGTVGQLARAGRDVGEVRSVFISHHHLDHTGGLQAVVGLRWMREFPGVITVYGPPGTKELVDGLVASMAAPARTGFGLGLPSKPADRIKGVDLADGQTVQLGDLKVHAVANNHLEGVGKLAKKNGALAFSYRFDLGARSITYTGDTGPDPRVTSLASGSNLLVAEVIEVDQMVELIKRQRPDLNQVMLDATRTHFTDHHLVPEDIGKMATAAKAQRVVMTHLVIPGALGDAAKPLFEKARAHFDGAIDIARDLSSYDVGCERD